MRNMSVLLLAGWLAVAAAPAAEAKDTGVSVELKLEADEVNAGETLRAGAVVTNHTRKDQLILVEGFLSPVAEPIRTPPVGRWERFVYEVLARISGDFELLHVPAGETRIAVLSIEVHPRMHGRFDVVATAHTPKGGTAARKSVISKITAPPANGGVLVHGMVYELGECRLLVTDDGHIYEPKGAKADEMFKLLDSLYPRPDGVTVLGGILPNTLGCFGVELDVDLYRYDRTAGEPVGVRWRHLSRGRSKKVYGGPDEEMIRKAGRFEEVVKALDAVVTGRKPNFRREMVAAVVVDGSTLTSVRIGRIIEKDGVLRVHYSVTNPGTICDVPSVLAEVYHLVALPKFSGPVTFVRHDVRIRCDADRVGTLDIATRLDLAGLESLSSGDDLGKSLRKQDRARRKTLEAIKR